MLDKQYPWGYQEDYVGVCYYEIFEHKYMGLSYTAWKILYSSLMCSISHYLYYSLKNNGP
jgi:hypothetical protein